MMIVLAKGGAEAPCTNKGRVIVGMMLIMIANADIQDFQAPKFYGSAKFHKKNTNGQFP